MDQHDENKRRAGGPKDPIDQISGDMKTVYGDVLMARITMMSDSSDKKYPLDSLVSLQREIDFSYAVHYFLFPKKAPSPDDRKMLGRIIEDAGKQRRMKQKYADYLATKGGSEGGTDRKLEVLLAEDA
jgi:hypothetical protein